MKNKVWIIGPLVLFVSVITIWLLVERGSEPPTTNGLAKASLRFGWIPSASFSGEIAGAKLFAKSNNLDLRLEAGGPGLNPIQLVQTGQDTFGTIAADEVLAANDKGADFVIIGVINYFSPGGFVSLEKGNVKTPQDLVGKKVGLLPFGSTTLLYESLLRKNNIDKKSITEIIVSPDLKPFLSGNYDVHPVFVYDETVSLDLQGIKYNLIEPKDFGVGFKGPVYFCKRETIEKQPELVEAFVRTMVEGWNYALGNQADAIGLLKQFAPEIDTDRERRVLEKAVPYYRGYKNQPINSDRESWIPMISELRELGVIRNDVDLERVLRLQFVQSYYGGR